MKRSLLSASLALAVAIGSIGIVPLAKAAAGDSTTFFMTKSAGAVPCLNTLASGRVTISDLGPVQNMHVEVVHLPANTGFTLCHQHPHRTLRPCMVSGRPDDQCRWERCSRCDWDLQS